MNRQLQFSFVDPSVIAIPPSALAAMPAQLAREENVMPVGLIGHTLTVATEDPMDFELIEKLGHTKGTGPFSRERAELLAGRGVNEQCGVGE